MRRRIGRKERKKQKKILIIGSISLLLFLCVGYAAFSTNLSLTAKGNIKELQASELLRKKCNTTTGDGLYKDEYEEGRCIYKGANPDNYITFNNETWRIISVEADNTIKIIKNGIITDMSFDSKGYRDDTSNGVGGTYCTHGSNGCNAWSISNNFSDGNYTGTVLKDAELNTYLNEIYYNTITETNKRLIANHTWGIGAAVYQNDDLANQVKSEKEITWKGNIGLITASDYIRANTNTEQCGNLSIASNNSTICVTTNWIQSVVSTATQPFIWTITPIDTNQRDVYIIYPNGNISGGYATANIGSVAPSLYLSSDITLLGKGAENNPYIITN